jgi:N-acetylglucosamine kinase-like BadF-type ATPase
MIRVGVDGGQSSIRLQVAGGADSVVVGGVGRLEADPVRQVIERVAEAWDRARGSETSIDRMVLGLTTLPSSADGREEFARLLAQAVPVQEVWLASDAVTAHAGAFPDAEGISLTVGTGVACMGINDAGESVRVDGDGFLLGDAGGAFWIGARGVGAVLQERDGRGPATALAAACDARYGYHRDLAAHLHSLPRPVDEIAHFAVDVQAAAVAGDALAAAIISAAADELVAAAVAAAATWRNGPARVALSGRVVGEGTALRTALLPRLREAGLEVRDAAGSPLEGSLRLASAAEPGPYDHLITYWKRSA